MVAENSSGTSARTSDGLHIDGYTLQFSFKHNFTHGWGGLDPDHTADRFTSSRTFFIKGEIGSC